MEAAVRRKTVLIVDDDPDVRLFVSGLMKSSGYRPVNAESRDDGFVRARSEYPDCIILNCMMGGEEGMALYKSLKTNDALKQIPVVMISPLARKIIDQHWLLRQGTISGPEAFIKSPPEAEKLVDIVEDLFSARV